MRAPQCMPSEPPAAATACQARRLDAAVDIVAFVVAFDAGRRRRSLIESVVAVARCALLFFPPFDSESIEQTRDYLVRIAREQSIAERR